MKHFFQQFWSFFENKCISDTDSPAERRSKVTLVVITGLCTIASIIWGTLYYVIFGPIITTFITYGFTVVLGAALPIYFITKRFTILLYVFFFMIFWNPIAMQWSLGGFAASGVVMLWSILAPFSSLMFQNLRKATGVVPGLCDASVVLSLFRQLCFSVGFSIIQQNIYVVFWNEYYRPFNYNFLFDDVLC